MKKVMSIGEFRTFAKKFYGRFVYSIGSFREKICGGYASIPFNVVIADNLFGFVAFKIDIDSQHGLFLYNVKEIDVVDEDNPLGIVFSIVCEDPDTKVVDSHTIIAESYNMPDC